MNTRHIPERRDFLYGAAALGLLGLSGCGGSGGEADSLADADVSMGMGRVTSVPPIGVVVNGTLRLPATFSASRLTVGAGTYNLGGGARSGALLYDGQWPSPLIRIVQGMPLDITLQNQLAEATNIHWHGLTAAPGMDGHPTELVGPNASKRYTFPVNERTGTYWYHPHPHEATARQAYFGLAGMLIVDDGRDAARGLPTGVRDIPLVLADKRVSSGALVYQPSMMDIMTGWLGNVITVNGTSGPVTTTVEPAVIRLRLLNASNARILNPALSDGRSFWLVATDGGLLSAPVAVTSLLLAPGERAEILLDLRALAGRTVKLVSAAFSSSGSGTMGGGMMGGGMMGGGMSGSGFAQGTAFDLLSLTVSSVATSNPGSIPVSFDSVARYAPAAAVANRLFQLTGMGGMSSGLHRINGLTYHPARIDFVVRMGELERWQFSNQSMEPHPMHVHGTQFQVISRNGTEAARLPTDLGWKDTVLVRSFFLHSRFQVVGINWF